MTSAQPVVGSAIRESSFSSVLLPAPLCPISPTASPLSIEKRDVAQRPKGFRLALLAAADGPADGPPRSVDDALAQRAVAALSPSL